MNRTAYFQSCLGVFQGGGCRAAGFAGAIAEAYGRGVYFAEVAGTSAGAIVAAFLGAGASPEFIIQALLSLKFTRLIKDPIRLASIPTDIRLACGLLTWTRYKNIGLMIRNLGLHSSEGIEDWVNEQLSMLLPDVKHPVKFSDLSIPTSVVATDLKRRRAQVWSSWDTREAEVAAAVRASCSIPGFFQPVQDRYVDGGVLSNLPAFVFFRGRQPLAKRALAFVLDANEDSESTEDASSIARAVVNTVIDGGRDLQLQLLPDVHVIRIETGDVKATDFSKMNVSVTRTLIEAGRTSAREFFDHEAERVRAERPSSSICPGREEMYAAIVENLDRTLSEVLIMDDRTDWVYALFPSLLYWRANRVRIKALITRSVGDALHVPYQKRLLGALGVEVVEVENVPARGWLFDSTETDGARAVIRCPDSSLGPAAVRYAGRDDFAAIDSLRSRFLAAYEPVVGSGANSVGTPILTRSEEAEVSAALKRVSQYKSHDCRIALRKIPISNMRALSRFVREYKFRQIARLTELYERSHDLIPFEPAAVRYFDGRTTIVTPPVVEETATDRYVLIEGTTRTTYCYRQGIRELYCMVVNSAHEPLPSQTEFLVKDVTVVGTTLPPTERYEGFNHKTFRHIEFAVHPTDSLT